MFLLTYTMTILIAEFIIIVGAKRKKYFWWKLAGFAVIIAALCTCDEFVKSSRTALYELYYIFMHSLIVVVSAVGIWLMFEESFLYSIDTALGAYAVQHIGCAIIAYILPYWDVVPYRQLNYILLLTIIDIPVYTALYFAFFRKKRRLSRAHDWKSLAVSLPVVFACLVFVRLETYFSDANAYCGGVYSIFCCVFTLIMQAGVLEGNYKRRELETANMLLERERGRYETWKSSIDLINIRFHDIKKIIDTFADELSDDIKKKIPEAIAAYDSILKTGNTIVDLILFEKNEYCLRNDIELKYMVDGKLFDSMAVEDVYSLLLNILDNAIECVKGIDSREKRIIDLKVIKQSGMLVVTEENFFDRLPPEKDGYFVTTKSDSAAHGYGLRSIKLLAERYGGNMKYYTDNGIFKIVVCIPNGENA